MMPNKGGWIEGRRFVLGKGKATTSRAESRLPMELKSMTRTGKHIEGRLTEHLHKAVQGRGGVPILGESDKEVGGKDIGSSRSWGIPRGIGGKGYP